MDAKTTVGRFIRRLREDQSLTQEQVASRTGISYQFLSGFENGRENISLDTLESLAKTLACPFPQLVAGAYAPAAPVPVPVVNLDCFRPQAPLPPGMSLDHLRAAMDATQSLIFRINANLLASGAKPLPQYFQGNNFSGLVSNILCDALHDHSPYRHNTAQRYPDLMSQAAREHGKPVGLEVKSTVQIGKGGESHNGHSGWHLIACFEIESAIGSVRFVHVMLAVLNGHGHPEPDWTYVGSKVNTTTGSRRTETYNTTLIGTTKLRDGSVYLDPAKVDFSRWRQARRTARPGYSIFSQPAAAA